MKNIIFLALLSVLPAHAIGLKDLKGKWSAKHTETTDGEGIRLSSSIVGSKGSNGTWTLKETVTYPVTIKATYTFQKDGKFKSVVIQSGHIVLSTYNGTWKASGGVIKISAKGTDGKFYATVTGDKNEFKVNGTFGSSKLTIKGRR
ncbi:MAG: hypothetical protein EOP88_15195 [Verrucomicrobiaceae bacterium]|nr:MAG: hypothetical protein EOP88_15195 [Verrucomicrobiaceae bacterium]